MANNPYVNKVVKEGTTLIDISSDTVSPSSLAQGYTAHDASGAQITGTMTGGSMVIRDEEDEHGGTIRHITAGDVVQGTKTITENGTHDVAAYADAYVNVPAPTPSLQSKTKSYTPSETAQSETVSADSGYDGLSSVKVNVGTISSTYVGSGIARKSSSDMTVSGAIVTAPAGYYSSAGSKSVSSMTLPTSASSTASGTSKATIGRSTSDQYINIPTGYNSAAAYYKVSAVANGTEGTPTATKGTVSNHAISVTPSVTNTAGYISGGTKTGTAVSVSASELVSGTLTISSSGTKDVTNYASASVAAGGATASATKGTVSNNSVTVTPSVTKTAGYITAGTSSGTAVTVTASELVSGNKEITENGTDIDVTNYATVSVDVSESYTCTISGTGDSSWCYVQVNQTGTKHYTNGDTFTYAYGDNLYFYYKGTSTGASISINSIVVDSTTSVTARSYTITCPHCDMAIEMSYGALASIDITVAQTQMASLTANGFCSVGQYSFANVVVPGMGEDELREYLRRNVTTFTTIDWPSNTVTIGPYAFASCSAFNPSSLPNTLTTISTHAFDGCTKLSLTSLPSTVTSIGQYAFQNCNKLALTSLPSGITKIDSYAFWGCNQLALTSLPSGVTTINTHAFNGCTRLALTSLPSGVTSIGASAFITCTSLALTSLPSGITKIDGNTFQGCTGLTTMTIPSGVSSIGAYAFYQCSGLTSVSLPSSLTSISNNAFSGCSGLTSISCDGAITTMNAAAFTSTSSTGAMSLVSASFPNMNPSATLSTVFGSTTAAYACQSLKTVDIGRSSGIAANAFANCYALDTLILRKTGSVCTLANVNAFLNTPLRGYDSKTGTVYVPSALIATYKTATNWKTMYDAGTVTFSAIEGSQYEL